MLSSNNRRRRPRPEDSHSDGSSSTALRQALVVHILSVVGLLLAFAAERTTAASSSSWSQTAAVEVGIRSALSNSAFLRRRRGASTNLLRKNSPEDYNQNNVCWEVSGSEADDNIRETNPAFFHPVSSDERDRLLTAEYAYYEEEGCQKRNRGVLQPESELDLLESLAVPCSSVRPVAATAVSPAPSAKDSRGGASVAATRSSLSFFENMIAGAISRSVAQTIMHPANTMKTIMQSARTPMPLVDFMHLDGFRRLSIGAGANFILSVPHGAVNFAVLEFVRKKLAQIVENTPVLSERADRIGPGLDFMSSAISTITCSVVSTPQMMITDNIMAGNYPNLLSAVKGLADQRGVAGFYAGWWPGLVGKIPSYALTWTFFQQLKRVRDSISDRPATNFENTIMGCVASGATVCIMMPMDTIKTRLVTQAGMAASEKAYKGIIDCALRVAREEGIKTFYRGISPRLISVVPMIGIQFGVYEFMKQAMVGRTMASLSAKEKDTSPPDDYGFSEVLQEAAMEVAASPEHPYPAPHFLKRLQIKGKKKKARKVSE